MENLVIVLIWALSVYGASNGLVYSALLKKPRDWLGFTDRVYDQSGNLSSAKDRKFQLPFKMVSCMMCISFWLGIIWSLVLFSPASLLHPIGNLVIQAISDGFFASGLVWLTYITIGSKQFNNN